LEQSVVWKDDDHSLEAKAIIYIYAASGS
jgi:hypothetical protein